MALNGTVRLVLCIIGLIITIIIALKAWIFLPQQVATQAAQSVIKWEGNTKEHKKLEAVEKWKDNSIEHKELEEDIETLDDEGMALVIDIITIKGDIKSIQVGLDRQEKRQKERHDEILDEIKELHK